ncbi:MAG: hypothetical protein KF782_17555 [Labilithrix sp.]|nr:hypothetical protein [Labilithrix sp.]
MTVTSSFGPTALTKTAIAAAAALGVALAVPGCSDDGADGAPGGGAANAACEGAPTVEKNEFCASCQMSPTATPATCKAPRTVNACCAWVAPPTKPLERGVGLNRYSGSDPTIQLSCLDDPGTVGAPTTVTLKGFVRLFSSGGDSAGAKIEIFREGEDGSLGEAIGTAVTTTSDDENVKKEDWLEKCPDGGCTFRGYTYPGVPTETRLIVKTSDATGSSQWAALYDYNVFFPTAAAVDGVIEYDPSVVAATDLNTVASAAGGFSPSQDKGMLAGEVHDCADVRLAGATVDIDAAHEGDMFYFGENETNPLPDKTRTSAGTSKLSLFGTLNVTTGVPIRISALGNYNGQTVLLATHTVQTFKGSVTSLRLRGRRPWQQ